MPIEFSEIRSVLEFLSDNGNPSQDHLAISDWSKPAFDYYSQRFNLTGFRSYMSIPRENNADQFLQTICKDTTTPGRVWLLFSHRMPETEKMLEMLKMVALLIDQKESPGAGVYLFNFSNPNLCVTSTSP